MIRHLRFTYEDLHNPPTIERGFSSIPVRKHEERRLLVHRDRRGLRKKDRSRPCYPTHSTTPSKFNVEFHVELSSRIRESCHPRNLP